MGSVIGAGLSSHNSHEAKSETAVSEGFLGSSSANEPSHSRKEQRTKCSGSQQFRMKSPY